MGCSGLKKSNDAGLNGSDASMNLSDGSVNDSDAGNPRAADAGNPDAGNAGNQPDGGTDGGPPFRENGARSDINLGGWMDSPHISSDGRELYFMYAPLDILAFHSDGTIRRSGPDRPGHSTSGDTPQALVNTDLYVARQWDDGGWYVSALTELNTPDAQECCAFTSWNGKSLYFMRSPIDESVRPKYWVAKRAGARFAAPVPTDLPVENGNIALDETETTLYFDANFEDPNAGAGKEIWSTTRTASGWAPVVRLPNQVNDPSKFSQTPWLSRDGERIYFHRFLASGAGSDIWVTSKENGFTEVTALPIVGPPFVPALNDRLIGEPSLNEDETLMYAVVYNAQGIPEIWSGRMSSTGVWNMKSVDVK